MRKLGEEIMMGLRYWILRKNRRKRKRKDVLRRRRVTFFAIVVELEAIEEIKISNEKGNPSFGGNL